MKKVILIAIISGIVSGLVGSVVIGYIQLEPTQAEIDELKNQNSILFDTLQDQKEKTVILNQTLQNMQKSLERESLISVKVLPHLEPLDSPFDVGVSGYVDEKHNRTAYHYASSISLPKSGLATFNIIITNVGLDTAILNKYTVEFITINETTGSWSTHNRDIREILESGEMKIISFEIESDSIKGPTGEIFFTVVHDNGISESYSLNYSK
jgi:hypothetical protein